MSIEQLWRDEYVRLRRLAGSVLRGIGIPEEAVSSAFVRLLEDPAADIDRLVVSESRTLRTATLRNRARESAIGLIPELNDVAYPSEEPRSRGLKFSLASFPEDFDAAVRGMSETQRETFILTDLRGLDQTEVAELLDVDQSTVSRRLDSARARVRRELT